MNIIIGIVIIILFMLVLGRAFHEQEPPEGFI